MLAFLFRAVRIAAKELHVTTQAASFQNVEVHNFKARVSNILKLSKPHVNMPF